jgi:hypothetical protein
MDSTSVFTHMPLASETRQIRLLKLGTSDDPAEPASMHCRIEHFDFDTTPEYIALSYVWGAESPTFVIVVNDGSFEIRQNLFSFMQRAKQTERIASRYFWIDQLCINQNDVVERASQVAMMGQIYECAVETISWLTTSDERYFKSMARPYRFWTLLLGDPYWTRLWIVQEIFHSPIITIMTGKYQWKWYGEEMSEALGTIKYYLETTGLGKQESNDELGALTMRIEQLEELRRSKPERGRARQDTSHQSTELWSDRERDLARTVTFYAELACSDPRDKIFGLLSLVAPTYKIPIDYTLTTVEVFERAVRVPSPYWCRDSDTNYLSFCAQLFRAMELEHGPLVMFKLALRGDDYHFPFIGHVKSTHFLKFEREYNMGGWQKSAAENVEALAPFAVSTARAKKFRGKRIRICPHEDGLTYNPYDPRYAHLLPPRSTEPAIDNHNDTNDESHDSSRHD